MPNIGDSVDRYVIEAVIGEGGMGRVYRALDPRLGRRVALKVLLAEKANERVRADAAARMMREARAAAAFNHPNVVAIHDVGEVGGNPYIAMELVSGETLREYLGNAGVSNEQKLAWLLDVARGLGAAHRAGLVHRDIKPDNVMITTDGVVKILDFGIARRAEQESPAAQGGAPTAAANLPSLTAEGLMIGTPQYMAPEQLQGAPVDGRADQFAWGVMAWELFAGALPWGKITNGAQLVAAVLATPVRPLSAVVPTITPDVSDAVARALSKNRETRFETMEGLLEALGGKHAPMPTPNSKSIAYDATSEQPSGRPSGGSSSPGAKRSSLLSAPTTAAPAVSGVGLPVLRTTGRAARNWRGMLVASAVCVVAAAAGAGAIFAGKPHILICPDTVNTADGPRCVRPVPAEALAKLTRTMRVTEVGGHTQTVEGVNFAGRSIPFEQPVGLTIGRHRDVGRTEVVRGSDGAVRELIARDPHGNVLEWQKWSEGGRRVDWVDLDGKTPRHWRETTQITGARREFDAKGRVVRETYVGASGRPREDEDGRYGMTMEPGKLGRPIRTTILSADGKPGVEASGGSTFTNSDDDSYVGRDTRYFDLNGQPACNGEGIHHLRIDIDDAQYLTAITNFDLHDQPAVILSTGGHALLASWSPSTRVEEVTLVDERGRPRPYKSDAWAVARMTYDERGRVTRLEALGVDGNPVMMRGYDASARLTWDERDDIVRQELFDTNGAPMVSGRGYAREERVYDDHGRNIEARYFDEVGHSVPNASDGPLTRRTYDDRGLEIMRAFFDAENHPFASVHGYASVRRKFDRLRNKVEEAYFGVDGLPCVSDEGVGTKRFTYDENDDLVAISYFDATGAPTTFRGEYSTHRFKNDERGLVIAEEWLDGHGNRTLRKDGYAALRNVLDRNGDVVEVSYFGKNDEPVMRAGGFAKKKLAYEIHRRNVEEALFDAAGALVIGSEGWAVVRNAYDDRGLVVRRDYLDTAKSPVLTKAGSASETKRYDPRGNVVEEATLGVDGKPIATADGYATKKSTYDERDELIEEALFGPDGEPVVGKSGWSIRRLRYDAAENMVEEAFFDNNRQPTSPAGASYASSRSRFDARQRRIETKYLDGRETPARGPDGVALVRFKHDAYGRVIETAYFDGTGAPAISGEGKSVVRAKYDDAGHPL
ncbi:MAG: serine/threonine-protein kinase, partial [Polyangiaceae bacterium]